jgi:hypothetical protein
MTVVAIFGNTVEFLLDNELNYLSTDDFVEEYGEDALFGDDMEVEEYNEGKIYKF